MTSLTFPYAELIELQLQQRLSRHRQYFQLDDLHVSLAIAPPVQKLDLVVSACWRGAPLRLLCSGAALASWLSHHLHGADFASLPPQLKLALLDQESKRLPGLTINALEPHASTRCKAYLSASLCRANAQLMVWLEGSPKPLMNYLPQRSVNDLLPVDLRMSLQTSPLQITPTELRSLVAGDVLLLPSGTRDILYLQGFIEGHAWAHFQQQDNQLELTAMHEDAPEIPLSTLSNFDQLPVNVSFEVGRKTLDLQTLATLQPGSLIDLATPLQGEVRLMVNQRYIGTGELVNIQDRLGVRIVRLLTDERA